MLLASTSVDKNRLPNVAIENMPLYLPSSFPEDIRSLSGWKWACDTERHLRIAQADDALGEIRKQRRIVQGLWLFKRINVLGTGNRPNTRILTLYNQINSKIDRAAQKYRRARAALLNLDPDGSWNGQLKELRKEVIRGPGRDPDNKTSNGRYEPSWIWLAQKMKQSKHTEDDFNEMMRVEWSKTRARSMRWQEEYQIIQEEMRRVIVICVVQVEGGVVRSPSQEKGGNQPCRRSNSKRSYGIHTQTSRYRSENGNQVCCWLVASVI